MTKITDASPPTPGVLDLGEFTDATTVEIAPWPLIKEGQSVWLDLDYDSQASPIAVIAGEKVTATEVGAGMTRSISKNVLKNIPHGALMQMLLAVNLNGPAIRDQALKFETLQLVVLQQGGADFNEDFEHFPLGNLENPYTTKNLTIGSTAAEPASPRVIAHDPVRNNILVLPTHPYGVDSYIQFAQKFNYLSFFYKIGAGGSGDTKVKIYGASGIATTQTLTQTEWTVIEFREEGISRLEFIGRSVGVSIDELTLRN